MVKRLISISEPFLDGQRVTGIAVEYDETFAAQSFPADLFEIPERNILSVYSNSEADFADAPAEGSYLIITLDPKDGKSSTLTEQNGRHKSMPREPRRPGGPGGPGGHGGPGGPGGPGGGPREQVLPDGRVFKGPSGLACLRPDIEIPVRQTADITAADGTVVSAWDKERTTDTEINKWVDLFELRKFEDIEYNIYIPEDYDPAKKYPLVMFIHDAGASGTDHRITLEQGIGATIFASPEEQKKHPCIVVAPQHAKFYPIANDNYWCFDDEHTYKRLIDSLQQEYSVDADRIYLTGQSMGFMTSLQLMIDYPDYFGGALLPAGHWDIAKTANLWTQNIWMFLSDEDRGGKNLIEKLPQAIEDIGGKLAIYRWDANQPTQVISDLIDENKNDGYSFHMTIFTGDSIMRPDQPDRTDGGGHNGTWHFVYQIEGARDWLFEQKR